jgi:hypothetical protein
MSEPDFRQARMILLRDGRVVPELVDLLRLARSPHAAGS